MRKLFDMILVGLLTSVVSSVPVHAQDDDFTAVMITSELNFEGDSFASVAWEGLQEFGQANGLEEDNGYSIKSNISEADYFSAFRQAIEEKYSLIIGVGLQTESVLEEFAGESTEQKFIVVDGEVELPNVASVLFKDYEAAFLAGIAAAYESETGKIGFIGGTDNEIIGLFEAGYTAGAKEINPDIEVQVHYLDWFFDSNDAYKSALEMYNNGADIIFHAAGNAGTGVFEAARELISEDTSREIWVIGADVDQTEEGTFKVDDTEYSVTLTSTLKHVDKAVSDLSQLVYDGDFEAKTYEYGMKEEGVDISAGQLSGETYDIVEDYRNQMRSGDLDVSDIVFE